jgi:homospermidine synthase
MNLRKKLKDKNLFPNKTTAVVDHGANPGLISHFVKKGLIDITERILSENDNHKLQATLDEKNYAKLAMELGVKVIHDSEWDTQITNEPKNVNEFVGTWSIEGFREEGSAPSEFGWGTHEEADKMMIVPKDGEKNQVFFNIRGFDNLVRSYIPNYNIIGMTIRHGENFTISEFLTHKDDNGNVLYRPTVLYAYTCCNESLASIWELQARKYKLQDTLRILHDKNIIKGADTLGALIMGHQYKSWWCGTRLSIDEARRLVPGQNATTIQVAISVVAAIMWMFKHPNEGFKIPDQLPHDEILRVSTPYLGEVISEAYDWEPKPDTNWQLKDFSINYEIIDREMHNEGHKETRKLIKEASQFLE